LYRHDIDTQYRAWLDEKRTDWPACLEFQFVEKNIFICITHFQKASMKKNAGFGLFLLYFFFISSCKKNNIPVEHNPVVSNVYVGGFYRADNNGNFGGLYWKNGIVNYISDEGQVYTVAVSDSNVLTTGTNRYIDAYAGNPVLNQYWSNNTVVAIPQSNASILSVAASGTDIYALGYYPVNNADTSYNISYWKNGNEIPLVQNNGSRVGVTPVISRNNDVYIAGGQTIPNLSASGMDTIFYWKNGQRVYVASSIQDNTTTGIAPYTMDVSGSDIYIFGEKNSQPVYWKNGVVTQLPDSINFGGGFEFSNPAHSFAVSGNDVYIAGSVNSKALYWKNGVVNFLTNGRFAYCIAVSGSDIYIGGTDNNGNAALWKNGVEQILGSGFPAGIVLQ
jgi:hypothetical protein